MPPSSTRLRIGVLFGGRSSEHDVSVLSATNVLKALDPARYEPVPIFVTREGQWLLSDIDGGVPATPRQGTELCLVPGGRGRMLAVPAEGAVHPLPALDILFPVLHGLHGEDGAVQGVAEVARVPLAGCGIPGSALALDKALAKRLLNEAGIATAPSLTITPGSTPRFADVVAALGRPVFVKPARQGSSVGVSKVSDEADYETALAEGFRHDDKLLAEAFIRGREIECSVLEDPQGGLFVSRPGEIVPADRHGFYSYDAKYVDQHGAALAVPADLPQGIEEAVRTLAAQAFRALGCDGMARVDVFVTDAMDILVNEVNTIPGFTDISMYPRAMAASGVASGELIDRLVAHGLARAARAG